jgi:trehalose transport system substrate-binding protein
MQRNHAKLTPMEDRIQALLAAGDVQLPHDFTQRVLDRGHAAMHTTIRKMSTVIGLGLLLLTLMLVSRLFPAAPVTMTVGVSQLELLGLWDVKGQLEDTLGAKIELYPIEPSLLVPTLDRMVAAGTMPWDLISVDNDTLGILVQKGLVQELSHDQLDEVLPRDRLFQALQEKLRVAGRDYFVPFRPNVKLLYYNQDLLRKAGYSQPPTTWEELEQLVPKLASDGLGRVAIQAHPGKAAAVTVFEWITSMGGDPLRLDDEGAREAFKRLWNLAPNLAPESNDIQFDTANNVLITDKVSMVDNWTYGIKEVMGTFKKTHIKVTPGLRESAHVLGGDVLAIPKGAPHPERAIKLIKQIVAKQTQRALAERLFWAPVRGDVYTELSAQQETKEYFDVIQKAFKTAVMRPITPSWGLVEEILSDALQAVLSKGRAAHGNRATDETIEELLRPYAERLRKIPEYKRCEVGANKTAGSEPCEEMKEPTEKFLKDLAKVFKTEAPILAKVNGRDALNLELDFVSPENMHILLVPKPGPRS